MAWRVGGMSLAPGNLVISRHEPRKQQHSLVTQRRNEKRIGAVKRLPQVHVVVDYVFVCNGIDPLSHKYGMGKKKEYCT